MRKTFSYWFIQFVYVAVLLTFSTGCVKIVNETNPDAHVPELISKEVTKITSLTAESGGNCSDGGAPVTIKGVCWSTSHNPTTESSKTNNSSGTGAYISSLTGLSPSTTYYVRAYAINRIGTGYGNEVSFTTQNSIITATIGGITATTAISGGDISYDQGSTVISRGVCWSTTPNPTIADNKTTDGAGIGSFQSRLTNLTLNTDYYVRAYAINGSGAWYGNELTFKTASSYDVGDSYGGGIIFYINYQGTHGLIAATSDQGNAEWGCWGTLVYATGTDIGTGQANTLGIINGCNESGIPAKLCDDLVLHGYGDWFLPSKDELNEMYIYRDLIGGFNEGTTENYYWSSSEYDYRTAWQQAFFNGDVQFNGKGNNHRVRAIRAF